MSGPAGRRPPVTGRECSMICGIIMVDNKMMKSTFLPGALSRAKPNPTIALDRVIRIEYVRDRKKELPR